MKKSVVLSSLCALLALFASSCNIFGPDDDGGGIPDGTVFNTTIPGLKLYFVDEDGGSIVDMEDKSTWPLLYPTETPASVFEESLVVNDVHESGEVKSILYNNSTNSLASAYGEDYPRFQTLIWGKTVEPEFRMFVYVAGTCDILTVGYKYTNLSSDPEKGSWGVEIASVRYNDTEVFNGNENGKVYVIKPSQGEAIVKIGSL